MDKIKQLMAKCGLKPELADRLCEGIEAHCKAYEQRKDAEFAAKLTEAKRVCVEETESYKRDLARRLAIFCEAKVATIEQTVAKQTAIKETDALTKLRRIQGLLEGVVASGGPHGDLQAEVKQLKRQVQLATETRDRAIETANRQTALADRVLKRNRMLESRQVSSPPVAEAAPLADPRRARPQAALPVSTRPTLRESQERRAPQRPAAAPAPAVVGVDQVADLMGDGSLV